MCHARTHNVIHPLRSRWFRRRTAWTVCAGFAALIAVFNAPRALAENNRARSDEQQTDWLKHEQGALSAAGSNSPSASRPLDQLWLISCRGLGTTTPGRTTEALHYWRLAGPGNWVASDRKSFASSDDQSLETCVFVAGYGYTSGETRELGRRAYSSLTRGLSPLRGVRFIIWSWPSDQGDLGAIRDVRAAASRTDRIAWYFAEWLDESASGRAISLIGTSFGARIVGGALHLLGGGRLGIFELPERSGAWRPAQVVFVSPAIDSDWLLPRHRFGRAMSQVERMLLLNNSADRVLKRYHWLYGPRSTVEALGHAGLRRSALADDQRQKIVQVDAASAIGSKHGCGPYFESPAMLARMRPVLFGTETPDPVVKGNSLPASFSTAK